MHCFDIGDTFCAKSGAIKASHSDGFQLHVEAHKRHGFTRVYLLQLQSCGHDKKMCIVKCMPQAKDGKRKNSVQQCLTNYIFII